MKNSGIVILLNFFRQLSFHSAVFSVFFLIYKEFDLGVLAMWFTLCKLTQALLEIPSGVFADKYGRKRSLQLSRICAFIVIVMLIFGNSVAVILLAAVLEGICNALYSDSDTSLVYDGMKKHGRTDLYPKFIAMYNGMGAISYGISSIIGALMATGFPVVWVVAMRLPIHVLHYYISKQLIDKVSDEDKPAASHTWKHFKESWKFVTHNRNLVKVMYFNATVFAFNLLVWDYWQVYGIAIALPTVMFGMCAALLAMAEGFPQFISYKYLNPKHFSRIYVVLLGAAGVLGLLAGMLGNQIGFALLVLSVFVTGFSFPVGAAVVQRNTDTKHRTTVASFSTLFGMLTYSLFSLFFGAIAQAQSIFAAFAFVGVVVVGALVVYIFMHGVRPWLNRHGRLVRLMRIPEGFLADDDRHRNVHKHHYGWGR